MTEHVEVLERDGAARLTEVRLDPLIFTPGLIDGRIVDAGSEWATDRPTPDPDSEVVTLAPHRGLPPGTPTPITEAFSPEPVSIAGPCGCVITPEQADDLGADVYILSTSQGFAGHARAFVESIIQTRTAIPSDTGLYLPGIATPANVSMLAYAGVDLVDTVKARIAGSRGQYLTPHGSASLESLSELPCACAACERGIDDFDRNDCMDHNVTVLRGELATIRQRIQDGRLRDYVSAQCRHVPWLTGALRRFDQEYAYREVRAPLYRQQDMTATTDDDLNRIAIRRFAGRVTQRYRNRFTVPLVLLPCSAKKPYGESQSHRQFKRAIDYRAHRVSLSSPVGVVPQELECTYPAQHYDIPVTGRWSEAEQRFVTDTLQTYLEEQHYPRIIAHVPPGPYRDIVESATDPFDIPIEYTVGDHPTTDVSLEALDSALEGESTFSRSERRRNTVKAVADYQFGTGAGDAFFPECSVEAPFPKHRVRDDSGEQLATMVPQYGLLALTLAGARRWDESTVEVKTVTIDDFVPHGNVLAPGIVDADPTIRPGDEVIVTGPSAFGIGRSTMHGTALEQSTRGVAVDVRHVEEQ